MMRQVQDLKQPRRRRDIMNHEQWRKVFVIIHSVLWAVAPNTLIGLFVESVIFRAIEARAVAVRFGTILYDWPHRHPQSRLSGW
jgi:hypothetical protein